MRPTYNTYMRVLGTDYSIYVYLLSTIVILFSMMYRLKLAVVLASAVWYSAFDAVVFFHVLRHRGTLPHDENLEALASYRVVQNVLMYFIALAIGVAYSWHEGALFILMWLSGACDVLYYIMLLQFKKMWQSEQEMWWVNFSIPAWFLSKQTMKEYFPFVCVLTFFWIAVYVHFFAR